MSVHLFSPSILILFMTALIPLDGHGQTEEKPKPSRLRVALAQIPVEDGDLDKNMRLAEEAAAQAARQKVDLLSLPEAADWGWLHQQARRDALPVPGNYTDFLAALAKRHHIWVSAGCLE